MVPVVVRGDGWFYRIARALLALTVAPAHRLSVAGTEHLPPTGPAIIAVNHKSDVDPILAGLAFRRALGYFAKAEIFAHPVLGRAVAGLGAIPVRRGEGDRRALEAGLACLAQGGALLLFPEGTRYPDDEIHPFQRGIGMLAVRTGAPVVPVALHGSRRIAKGGRRRLPKVRLLAGPPVDLAGLEGRRSAVYSEATGRIERAVRSLYERLDATR